MAKGGKGGGNGGGSGDSEFSYLRLGRGDDDYHIDDLNVRVAENKNGGTDTVFASVDYALDPEVENLTFTGEEDLSGSGNELDNIIVGNIGDNTLSGGAGNDAIDGGEGYDTAVYKGDLADYSFVVEGETIFVTSAFGETDQLVGIEKIAFLDAVLLVLDLVDPAPNAPQAVDDYGSGSGEIVLAVLANDTGEGLEIASATDGVSGTVVVNEDGTITYTPTSGTTGTDSFTYTVIDSNGMTSSAEVTLEITSDEPDPTPTEETPYYVDGLLLDEQYRLNPDDPIGTGTVVTYAFADTTPSYYSADHFAHLGFQSFTEDMREATRQTLNEISQFADITFVETSVEEAGIVFGVADIPGSATGVAYYPDAYTVGTAKGDVWIDVSLMGQSFEPGSEAYETLIHEIGHTLGLKHADLPLEEETRQFSVMSRDAHATFDGEPDGFLLYDIAAIQHYYGANETATAGDDTYTFGDLDESLRSIWDAGGHDTIDLSSATYGVNIDLREGEFSTVSTTGTNNISLAYGSVVEDAIGSDYADEITGNAEANFIDGGAGDDTVSGGDGEDRFAMTSSSGNDTVLDFAKGQDKIDLTGSEAFSIDDLFIVTDENGTSVQYGDAQVYLEGVEEVDEADFLFAAV